MLNKEMLVKKLLHTITISIAVYVLIKAKGHIFLVSLQMVFFFSDLLVLERVSEKTQSVMLRCFRFFSFVRYAVLPFLMVFTGNYDAGQRYTPNFNKAVMLMSWELIASSLFLILYIESKQCRGRKLKYQYQDNLYVSGRYVGYGLFICFSIMLSLIFSGFINQLSFLTPRLTETQAEAASIGQKLTVYVVSIAKNLFYVIVISCLKKKYDTFQNDVYYIMSIVVTFLNVAFFFGTSRIAVAIPAIVSILLLIRLYPSKKMMTTIVIGSVMVMVIVYISISRNVMMGVQTTTAVFRSFTSMIDAYLGGIHNVGVSIETRKLYAGEYATVSAFIQEFLRYVIGISIFYKGSTTVTSGTWFTYVFSEGLTTVGQVIPIIGVGYYYFGFFLAPILEIIFLYITLRLEDKVGKSQNPYVFVCVMSFSLRVGMIGGQNPQLLMSNLISFVVIPLILFKINRKIKVT